MAEKTIPQNRCLLPKFPRARLDWLRRRRSITQPGVAELARLPWVCAPSAPTLKWVEPRVRQAAPVIWRSGPAIQSEEYLGNMRDNRHPILNGLNRCGELAGPSTDPVALPWGDSVAWTRGKRQRSPIRIAVRLALRNLSSPAFETQLTTADELGAPLMERSERPSASAVPPFFSS